MKAPERVVFDCNIFFQALLSPNGPAGQALEAAATGKCQLFASGFIVDELRDVLAWPHLVERFQLTSERVNIFLESIAEIAAMIEEIPAVFEFPRDPDDAQYVNLALAARAKLIVSRDRDLLSLGDRTTPEGQDFYRRFPELEILTPTELLIRLTAE